MGGDLVEDFNRDWDGDESVRLLVVAIVGVVADVVVRVDDKGGEDEVEGSAGDEDDEVMVVVVVLAAAAVAAVVAAREASLWAAWLGRTMYWHCRPKAWHRAQGSCPLHFIFWVRQLEQPL